MNPNTHQLKSMRLRNLLKVSAIACFLVLFVFKPIYLLLRYRVPSPAGRKLEVLNEECTEYSFIAERNTVITRILWDKHRDCVLPEAYGGVYAKMSIYRNGHLLWRGPLSDQSAIIGEFIIYNEHLILYSLDLSFMERKVIHLKQNEELRIQFSWNQDCFSCCDWFISGIKGGPGFRKMEWNKSRYPSN